MPSIEYDSQEEEHFAAWLGEGMLAGFIAWSTSTYHEVSFELSPKRTYPVQMPKSIKERHLFHSCTYTPDFVFDVTPEFRATFPKLNWHYLAGNMVHADIKGGWTKPDEVKCYNILRKWVFQRLGVYIQTVKIGGAAPKNNLFLQTWVPEAARLTPKTRQVVKKYEGAKTIGDYNGN